MPFPAAERVVDTLWQPCSRKDGRDISEIISSGSLD